MRMITNVNPELSDYQPKQAVIVTWFEGRLFTNADFDDPLSDYEVVYQEVAS